MRRRSYVIVTGLTALGLACSSVLLPSLTFAASATDVSQSGSILTAHVPEATEAESGGEVSQSGVSLGTISQAGANGAGDLSDQGALAKLTTRGAPVRCTDAYTQGVGSTYVRIPAWMPYNGFSYNCYLDRGAENYGVTELQYSLKYCNGQNIAVDGVFGAATEQAVKNVQYNHGLVADGVYGPNTGSKMTWRAYNGACLHVSLP